VAYVDPNQFRCGPCRLIAPVFAELSDEFDARAVFVKVDVDQNPVREQ
jgi:thioredoxin 1